MRLLFPVKSLLCWPRGLGKSSLTVREAPLRVGSARRLAAGWRKGYSVDTQGCSKPAGMWGMPLRSNNGTRARWLSHVLLSVTLDLATSRYFIYSQPVIKHPRIIWLSNADEIYAWNKIIMKDRWDQFGAYDSKHPSPMCQQEILRFPNNKHILGFRVFACLVFTA